MIFPDSIAQNFPSLAGKCYLNTAAEGIPPRSALRAVEDYLADKLLGRDGREAQTRNSAARLLGLSPEEVRFCSCSAEVCNLLACVARVGQIAADMAAALAPWPSQKTSTTRPLPTFFTAS